MKKNIIIIICGLLITILMFIIGGFFKNNNDKNTIKVAEVTHSAFYTPFYVAIEKGFFEENNIDIDLILTSGANNVVAAVLSGDVQIGLCGPEATIYVYNENQKDYVQTFAGLTTRPPVSPTTLSLTPHTSRSFMLYGRTHRPFLPHHSPHEF